MSENENGVVESTLQKLEVGEINYQALDHRSKNEVQSKVLNELDDKGLQAWKEGWKPKAMFGDGTGVGKDREGNEIHWKSADEFLEARKIPQIARERDNKLLAEENRKLKEELEKVSNVTKFTAERGIQADEEKIAADIKQAKEYGDIEAYERALEKKKVLDQERSKINQYYQQPVQNVNVLDQLTPEDRNSFLNFKVEVPQLGTDPVITQFITNEWEGLQHSTSLTFQEKLDYIKNRTTRAYPDRFGKPMTFMPTTNTVNNKLSTPDNSKITYEKLSPREQNSVDRLVLSKKFPSREAVIKQFFK